MGRYFLILLAIWGTFALLQVAEVPNQNFFWTVLTLALAGTAAVRLMRQPLN